MTKWTQHQKLTTLTRVVLLIAFYFIGGLAGKETSFLSGRVALVWPPAGIALAAILLFGYRFWPGVALGAVLFSFMNGMPFGFFTLGTAVGNTMGAITCAYLLKKFVAFDNAMERTSDVTGYIGLACILGTTVNAMFNVVSLAYSGAVAWDNLFSTTLVWWVPNALADYPKAIGDCLLQLKDAGHIQSESDLAAVGFKTIMARGVNGCVRLDESVVKAMEAFNGIAPAHNPPYITGIRFFAQRMPDVPLVGLFETAFYQWAPAAAMRYAVPDAWYELGVQRWGFHGASHKFIAERSAELLGRDDVADRARQLYVNGGTTPVRTPDLRVISCHLGGSSSITGILNGVAMGTSMGLSPQSGLPQNNRVGDLDSFALPFLMRSSGLTLEEAERLMCKEIGRAHV